MIARIGLIGALSLLLGIDLGSEAQAETFEQRIAGGLELTARDYIADDGILALGGLLQARGGPGAAQVAVLVEAGAIEPPTDCPDGFDVQQPIVGGVFVTTFKDLSMLSGAGVAPGQPVRRFACLDLETGNIFAVVNGRITGGNGRFKGATGTWEVNALAEPAGFGAPFGPLTAVNWRLTGTIVYELDFDDRTASKKSKKKSKKKSWKR